MAKQRYIEYQRFSLPAEPSIHKDSVFMMAEGEANAKAAGEANAKAAEEAQPAPGDNMSGEAWTYYHQVKRGSLDREGGIICRMRMLRKRRR
jgi:hypothetical protein